MFSWRYQYDEKPGACNILMHRLEIQAPPLWRARTKRIWSIYPSPLRDGFAKRCMTHRTMANNMCLRKLSTSVSHFFCPLLYTYYWWHTQRHHGKHERSRRCSHICCQPNDCVGTSGKTGPERRIDTPCIPFVLRMMRFQQSSSSLLIPITSRHLDRCVATGSLF